MVEKVKRANVASSVVARDGAINKRVVGVYGTVNKEREGNFCVSCLYNDYFLMIFSYSSN